MLLRTLFSSLWKYNKALTAFIILFIVIQLYYNYQFIRFARLVDNHQPVDHPYGFEAFPFVVYNMYSGKMDDWNKYSYLKIDADGKEVFLTDLAVLQEDQFVNPTQKFTAQMPTGFNEENLRAYLHYLFNPQRAERIYYKTSNLKFAGNEQRWGEWLKKYLSVTLKRDVHKVEIYDCVFMYDAAGKPQWQEQKLLYHTP
jgi:hypothetical protein